MVHISLLRPYHGDDPQQHFIPLPSHPFDMDTQQLAQQATPPQTDQNEHLLGTTPNQNREENMKHTTSGSKNLISRSETPRSIAPFKSPLISPKITSQPFDIPDTQCWLFDEI